MLVPKNSYFRVSEAALFETVFETQKSITKYQKSVIFRLFLSCFDAKKEVFVRLKKHSFFDSF